MMEKENNIKWHLQQLSAQTATTKVQSFNEYALHFFQEYVYRSLKILISLSCKLFTFKTM